MAKAPARSSAHPARRHRLVLGLLALQWLSGCAGSPWTREVIYSASGVVLYREQKEIEGKRVALGYKHPFELPADKAVLILSQMVFEESYLLKKSQDQYVFTPEQVRSLVPPLCVALKGMGPDERLRFLVTQSNWTEAFLGVTGTSGVAFSSEDGVLDFAFDRIQEKVAGADEGNPSQVVFHGEPTENPGGDPLVPRPGTALRLDPATGKPFPRWLAVKVADVKPFAPAEAPPKPAVEGEPTDVVVPERPPLEKPPAEASPPEEEARYQEIKKRLEAIKRLRMDGALTEEEYQKEYQKILAEMGQKSSN